MAKCELKKSGILACFTHCVSWPGKVENREVGTLSAVFFLSLIVEQKMNENRLDFFQFFAFFKMCGLFEFS